MGKFVTCVCVCPEIFKRDSVDVVKQHMSGDRALALCAQFQRAQEKCLELFVGRPDQARFAWGDGGQVQKDRIGTVKENIPRICILKRAAKFDGFFKHVECQASRILQHGGTPFHAKSVRGDTFMIDDEVDLRGSNSQRGYFAWDQSLCREFGNGSIRKKRLVKRAVSGIDCAIEFAIVLKEEPVRVHVGGRVSGYLFQVEPRRSVWHRIYLFDSSEGLLSAFLEKNLALR